ncbi:MAG: DUF3613 domain-containing protein [Comamonas sp.]
MTFHFAFPARRHFSVALLLGLAGAGGAHAQADRDVAAVEVAQLSPAAEADSVVPPSVAAHAIPAPAEPLRVRRIEIGSATQALWDLQRASPGVRPRPIDGDQASRSYQRYLKSFETTIPEHYNSGLGLEKKK